MKKRKLVMRQLSLDLIWGSGKTKTSHKDEINKEDASSARNCSSKKIIGAGAANSSQDDVDICDFKINPDPETHASLTEQIYSVEDCQPSTSNFSAEEHSTSSLHPDNSSQMIPFRGPAIEQFVRRNAKSAENTKLQSSDWLIPDSNENIHYLDKWDQDHVRLPCSDRNLYPMDNNEVINRWGLIQTALRKSIKSSFDLEDAILSYNNRFAESWNFRALHKYCNEILDKEERDVLFNNVLPKMIDLACSLPNICPEPIPLIKSGTNRTIVLSQKQISCLLANAFFCTFPRRNASNYRRNNAHEYANYPHINFDTLFASGRLKVEKLKFILHYFNRIFESEPTGVVSFQRKCLDQFPDWSQSERKISNCKLHVSAEGTIEDFGIGMLQVDFANKFIGGGVLNYGAVQEEIRFLINPELLVSMLFMEKMKFNEAIIITGCERYSNYTGYGDSLQFLSDHKDITNRDSVRRRQTEIVAIDALPYYKNSFVQLSTQCMKRELNKAFCGFSTDERLPSSIATGNWGCGAFGGNIELKSIIQLLAAAESGRNLVYFTFGNYDLMDRFFHLYEKLVEKEVHIRQMMIFLEEYSTMYVSVENDETLRSSLYDFIAKKLNIPTRRMVCD